MRALLAALAALLLAPAAAGAAEVELVAATTGLFPGFSDGTVAQRAAAGGTPSACGAPVPAEAAGPATAYRRYLIGNATNEPACVTVAVNSTNPNVGGCVDGVIGSVAYAPALDPADGTRDRIGTGGLPNASAQTPDIGYGFTLPGRTGSTVVVQQDGPNPFACTNFAIRVTADRPFTAARPTLSGTPYEGRQLAGVLNAWRGATTVTRQWRRCDAAGEGCQDVPGATAAGYPLTAADIGATLRLRAIATDGVLTSTSDSLPSPVVLGLAPAPVYTVSAAAGEAIVPGTTAVGVADGTPQVPLTLPFGVELFGRTVTETVATLGGTLQFGPAALLPGDQTPACGAAVGGLGGALIPYLGTWQADSVSGEGVFSRVTGTAPDRVLTLDWRVNDLFLGPVRFAVRLREGSPTVSFLFGSGAGSGLTTQTAIQQTRVGPVYEHRCDAAPPPPSTRVDLTPQAPTLDGTPAAGVPLGYVDGGWTGTAPLTFGRQWLRCDAAGAGCTEIPGATGATYTPGPDDAGRTLRVRVWATNVAGIGIGPPSAASAPLPGGAPPPPPPPPPPPAATPPPPPPPPPAVAPPPVPACGAPGRPACPLATLSALAVTPARVRPASSGGALAAVRPAPAGALVGWQASAAANVRFSIVAIVPGRRVGARCAAPARANRGGAPCGRLQTRLTFTRAGRAGANTLALTGRLSRTRALPPGGYRLLAVPVAGARTGRSVAAAFRVVR